MKIFLFLLSFLFVLNSFGQFDWAISMKGSTSGFDIVNGMETDEDGNLYLVGQFQGTVDFDPGPATITKTATQNDIFIQKLDSNGNLIWVHAIGGVSSDIARDITIDSLGNIYITGLFGGTVDFDPGLGLASESCIGLVQPFVLKLDSSGNFIWIKTCDNQLNFSQAGGTSIEIDVDNNIMVSGDFLGSVDFDPGLGSTILTSSQVDFFAQKLDSAGNLIWVKQISGTSSSFIVSNSLSTDLNGNFYFTGTFNDTVDFDPGPSITTLSSASNASDIFILKLDSIGNLDWVKTIGNVSSDVGRSIKWLNSGNLIVNGYFGDTVDFNPGAGTFNLSTTTLNKQGGFILKLTSVGNFIWAKAITGTDNVWATNIDTDQNENYYNVGNFSGTADLDPGAPILNLNSTIPALWDIFIQKLDSAGNLMWAVPWGVGGGESYQVETDNFKNVYVAGKFSGTWDFDPSSGVATLTAPNSDDVYVFNIGEDEIMLSTGVVRDGPVISESKIYPNPVTDHIIIEVVGKLYNLAIYNSLGQLLYTESNILETSKKFDVSKYPKGLIFIKIESESKVYSKKILKQ